MATVKNFKTNILNLSPLSERNFTIETLYDSQFTLSTQLIISNYPVILSHWCSTTLSLETYPFILNQIDLNCELFIDYHSRWLLWTDIKILKVVNKNYQSNGIKWSLLVLNLCIWFFQDPVTTAQNKLCQTHLCISLKLVGVC